MNVLSVKKSIIGLFVLVLCAVFAYSDTTHKVEKGDTLYSISKKYNVTLAELRSANGLSDSDVIKIGQTLKIPGKDAPKAPAAGPAATETYIVQKGDTLYGIARKFDMKINDLLDLNNLTKDSVIKVGQKVKIKKAGPGPAPIEPAKTTPEPPKPETKAPDTRTYGSTVESDTSTIWPVKNPTVTTVKGKASGVQLSAQTNEPVKCIREGTVMYIGVYRGFGQVAFVQSKTGIIYVYAGLSSVTTKKGNYVVSGDEIGKAGIDSITGKPQITFMVFQNGQPIDPKTAPRN